jgi:hypothetical protein
MDALIVTYSIFNSPYAMTGGFVLIGFIVAISVIGYLLEEKIRRDLEREGLGEEAAIDPVSPVRIEDFTIHPFEDEEHERRAA